MLQFSIFLILLDFLTTVYLPSLIFYFLLFIITFTFDMPIKLQNISLLKNFKERLIEIRTYRSSCYNHCPTATPPVWEGQP
jgi:hypothetical protein